MIFPSSFWLNKDRISNLRKVQNKNVWVISINIVFYAKENIILPFSWELKDHLSRSLQYHTSPVNVNERSFYQLSALKKISFYSQKSITPMLPLSKKFIIWTSPFEKSSCFCNNFFLFFMETYVSSKHFIRRPSSLFYKEMSNRIKELFTLWIFSGFIPILVVSEIPWNRIWHFNFADTETKASAF